VLFVTNRTDEASAPEGPEECRDSGKPGGGAGRVEDVHGSGVYPMSGPLPEGNAEIRPLPSWGQGDRGAAGYEDHGDSELHVEGALGGADEDEERDKAA
jgi:hypothetical protein